MDNFLEKYLLLKQKQKEPDLLDFKIRLPKILYAFYFEYKINNKIIYKKNDKENFLHFKKIMENLKNLAKIMILN